MTPDELERPGVSRQTVPLTPALRALIGRRMDDLDLRGARALAARTGGEVSYGSVHRILHGQQARLRMPTVRALAEALEVPPADLLAAAYAEHGPWVMPPEFDAVPTALRDRLQQILYQLLTVGGHLPVGRPAEDA